MQLKKKLNEMKRDGHRKFVYPPHIAHLIYRNENYFK